MDPEELRVVFERAVAEGEVAALPELVRKVAEEAEDARWAEVCCAQLARHRNAQVKGSALAALGHLARRFGRLDRRRVQRLVENGLHARHEFVREQAESAAADMETHLSWRFDRPEPRGR